MTWHDDVDMTGCPLSNLSKASVVERNKLEEESTAAAMANKGILVGVILFILIFSLAPNLVWVIIGAQEIDARCQTWGESPNLAAWLVVEGSVGIFVNLVSVPLILIHGHAHTALLVVSQLFFLAWNIVGAYRVSQDTVCEEYNTRLYNTALAAVIYGFVSVFCSLFQGGGAHKSNDDEQ
jgi:hypothetical protein